MDTCGHILTEGSDFLDTEASDRLVTECFVAPTAAVAALPAIGISTLFSGGKPVYISPRKKKKKPYPEDEIEEEEIDEILSMLGIEL